MVKRSFSIKAAIFLIFAVVIGTPLFYLRTSWPYVIPRTVYFQALVELLFFVWLGIMILEPKYRPRLTPLSTGLLFLGGALVLASFTGVDFWRSIWSSQERAAGVFLTWHGIVLALILSSLREHIPWRKLFMVSVLVASVVSVLALLQLKIPDLLLAENPEGRPGGTFGNPAIMSAYLLFNVFLAAWLCLEGKVYKFISRGESILLMLVLLVLFAGIFISQTRAALLGLFIGFTLLLLYFAIWPISFLRRRWLFGILGSMLVFGLIFGFTRNQLLWRNVPLLNRFQSSSAAAQNFSARILAARAAVQGFWERPLTGWGPENFNVVFNQFYDPGILRGVNYPETRLDKPHNFFLEYLVTGGILVAGSFLVLIGLLFQSLWRLRSKPGFEVAAGFLGAAYAAYMVQNLFFFDTLGALLMFFVLLGYVLGQVPLPYADKQKSLSSPVFRRTVYGSAWAAGLMAAYLVNAPVLRAAYYQNLGSVILIAHPQEGFAAWERAVRIREPYQWAVKRDFALTVAELYYQGSEGISPELARSAAELMEGVAGEHSADAFNWNILVDIYNQISVVDRNYLLRAQTASERAFALSPRRQEFYFSRAQTKTRLGEYESALALLKQAVDLNPAAADPHFYYGTVAFLLQDPELGYREVAAALGLGRPWRNVAEMRIIANYFAQSGRVLEAIPLYQNALGVDPGDPLTRIGLGKAYYLNGDLSLARETLRPVLIGIDKRDALYSDLLPVLRALELSYPSETQ